MSVTPIDVSDFFERLRLTTYEKLAYLTLVLHGPQTYKVLTKRSTIPYGRVYSVMARLARRGWAVASTDRPKVFRAVDPQVVVANHLAGLREALYDTEVEGRRVLSVLRPLYQRSHTETRGDPVDCRARDRRLLTRVNP
jgi:sugar-specific transcriptional regulator TrmB